ncbi:MAG: helix-turn-helix domain-containing protein [Nanoarchaeota archaeon]
MKQELINRVRDYFDLNIYETKVWLALLSKGVSSAGEIAENSGVPRSRTYDVLESLEKSGFAIMKLGKPVKYIAVKPDVVIEKLKSNVLKNANEKVESIKKLRNKEEYQELKQLYTNGIKPIKQEEISGSIKGRLAIYSHIKELLENAKKEVVVCTSVQELIAKSRFFSVIFERLKKNNVKVKIALFGDEKEINRINKKLKINAKPISVDARFFIADSEQVLFMISNGNEEEISVWLNTPFFVSTLAFMTEKAVS